MSASVRDQLIGVVQQTYGAWTQVACERVADAMLERFEVTPKPVVNQRDLGLMVAVSAESEAGVVYERLGRKMLDQLDAAGLRIVRVDE